MSLKPIHHVAAVHQIAQETYAAIPCDWHCDLEAKLCSYKQALLKLGAWDMPVIHLDEKCIFIQTQAMQGASIEGIQRVHASIIRRMLHESGFEL